MSGPEGAPRHREQRVIRIQRSEYAKPGAFDVERAVGIQQSTSTLTGDDGTEPEIALRFGLFIGRCLKIVL